MSIRVLVADDQSMVRAGFRMLLSSQPDIEVVAEASNGLEAVEKAARFAPTVVLMDIRMPELDGLEAARRILAADDAARILILTTFDHDEYVYEALRAGASGVRRYPGERLRPEPPLRGRQSLPGLQGGEMGSHGVLVHRGWGEPLRRLYGQSGHLLHLAMPKLPKRG
jgi:chemotaxis response regulator CheB